jgi:hypothetical protein
MRDGVVAAIQIPLPGSDSIQTDLGSVLRDAKLQCEGEASHARDADCTQLQGALLGFARLQGTSLGGARLQGAWLDAAQLQGASLYFAQLQGASLVAAKLQGASLNGARLQGASLDQAELQAALLLGTQLQGASLDKVKLAGASLDYAQLQTASFQEVWGWRADLNLDFSNSISLWRRMKPATAVSSGNGGKFDRVGALWFEVRGLRVRRRAASHNASPGGRAPSLGAAERYTWFSPGCAAQEELKARRRYR